jgi:NADH dehydrogenase FAD-containing subunit
MPNILIPAISVPLAEKIYECWNNFSKPEKKTVHVIGNGWGAYYFVKSLDKSKYSPVIIAPNARVTNTPKLTEFVANPNTPVEFPNPYPDQWITDTVEDIDPISNQLILASGTRVNYSRVVLAIGSEPNDFNIPGVQANTFKLKTIADARLIQSRIPNLKLIYIIGCGVTGIELAGKLDKFGAQIKIVEGFGEILPGWQPGTKSHIYQKFQSDYPNVQFHLNTQVQSISNNTISTNDTISKITQSFQFAPNSPEQIIIWTGGVRFNGYGKTRLAKKLNSISPVSPRGILVNPDFSIGSDGEIFCIGDMVGNSGPPTAQNAKAHAIWLAGYFNGNFNPEYLTANKFEVKSSGQLIHLDHYTWLESKYYTGQIPNWIAKLFDLIK